MICDANSLREVAEAFGELRRKGRIRFTGLTGLGETASLHGVIDSGKFDVIQTIFNLLNPSAGYTVPEDFYAQDYRRLIDDAAEDGMRIVVIRALAGGALTQSEKRHQIAAPVVGPLGSGRTYREDVSRSGAFDFMVQQDLGRDVPEAAIRFAISKKEVSAIQVGYSDTSQLEKIVKNASKGLLSSRALVRLESVWKEFGFD